MTARHLPAPQCRLDTHCVLNPGHDDYCLDERPLFEELQNIASASSGRDPGGTLSHRTANACVRFGWATRNEDGDFEATPRGRALATIMGDEP